MQREDAGWMRRAVEEAWKGAGRTAPNPAVGAVVVKDGVELGAGWHQRAGLPHAEREAMARVREAHGEEALRGATVYVTLEPCSTCGRTPACTDGLIEAGVARVVYAVRDPNPRHAGRADGLLEAAGIEVASGVLEEEAEELIRGFRKVQETGLPWVMVKTAMSLDGRLTRPPGEGMWLTGPEARREVQRIRAESEAIVTSGRTVREDRPRLDLREAEWAEGRETPWRVVVTRDAAVLPKDAPMWTDANRHRTLVHEGGDLEGLLRGLERERQVQTVLVEAGGELAAAFLEAGLVDEWVAFLAPVVSGAAVAAVAGEGLGEGLELERVRYARFGEDVQMRGWVKRR